MYITQKINVLLSYNCTDKEVYFVVTHLRHHIYIQREDTSTYLVYNDGVFSHKQEETNNHIFEVTYDYHGTYFTLKAVNHMYSDESGSGSASGSASGSGMENEDIAADLRLRDSDCYLGFTSDGQPICYSSNSTETGDFDRNVLFISNCLSS